MKDTVVINSGSPKELEVEVPSEPIEFPLRIVQSFPTLDALIRDLGCDDDGDDGDAIMVDAPEIMAETLRDLLEFCTTEPYEKFLTKYHEVREELGPDDIDVEKFDCFSTLVGEGAKIIDEKFGISENPNNERLIEMYLGAEYLDSRFIKKVGSELLTPHIIGKTPEEIQKTFNIDLSSVTEEDKAWGRQYLRENENIDIPEPA